MPVNTEYIDNRAPAAMGSLEAEIRAAYTDLAGMLDVLAEREIMVLETKRQLQTAEAQALISGKAIAALGIHPGPDGKIKTNEDQRAAGLRIATQQQAMLHANAEAGLIEAQRDTQRARDRFEMVKVIMQSNVR